MPDLIEQAGQLKAVIRDASLPNYERLTRVVEAFSELLRADLDEGAEELSAGLTRVREKLARYSPPHEGDDQSFSEADLRRLLDLADEAASLAAQAGSLHILAELDAGVHRLPEEAIRQARKHRDLMIPGLIEVIRSAVALARAGEPPKGNAHFFALFLLLEFKVAEALPVMVEAFSLPGDLPFDLFGEAVHSALPRALVLFSGERPEAIDALIGDRALNEYVRWAAANAYLHLVRDGRMERDEAVRRLQQLLRRAIDENDHKIAGGLISELADFAPREAMEDIREAYRRGVADPSIISLPYIEQSLAEGEAQIRGSLDECPPTPIEDTIEELRHWASFQEKPRPSPAERRVPLLAGLPTSPAPSVTALREPMAARPLPARAPRVGRNDPCPCGSGKKFKKCCGART